MSGKYSGQCVSAGAGGADADFTGMVGKGLPKVYFERRSEGDLKGMGEPCPEIFFLGLFACYDPTIYLPHSHPDPREWRP